MGAYFSGFYRLKQGRRPTSISAIAIFTTTASQGGIASSNRSHHTSHRPALDSVFNGRLATFH